MNHAFVFAVASIATAASVCLWARDGKSAVVVTLFSVAAYQLALGMGWVA